MTKLGTQFAALAASALGVAMGSSHNAAMRGYKNKFALATEGGTTEPLQVATLGAGCVFDSIRIETDANLSTMNFLIGTPADPDKYGTAVAGPNAVPQTRYPLIALPLDAIAEGETIILTPSANIPSVGSIRTTVMATHR
jgi:hypothetical protein